VAGGMVGGEAGEGRPILGIRLSARMEKKKKKKKKEKKRKKEKE
jgi:hypothetical protein